MSEQLELEHVLALSRQVTPTFICLMAGAFAGVAAASPWFGWHTLIAPVLAGIPAGVIAATADRFRRPERALALNWLLFQTSIAVGFLSARGAPLFALTLLALMVPGNCTMLPPRVSIPSIVYSTLMLGVVAVDLAGTSAILHNPSIVLFPTALIVEAGYIGVVICRSAVGFRGASVIDPLTGLLNRAALQARLDELEVQAPSVGRPVAILLADLDHFKAVNDRVGHAVGDAVLRETASRILGCLRTFESAYRVGGEEFLVLLPAADASAAQAVAERIWHAVRERPCAGLEVTISVGAAVAEPGAPFTYEGIFRRADEALYEAKRQGRDRVCVDGPGHATVAGVPVSEAA